MNVSLRQCQFLLVAAYLSFNVVACFGTVSSGTLQDEFAGLAAPSQLACLLLLLGIVLSYILVLFPLFDAFRHVGRFSRARREIAAQPAMVHLLVMLLQASQLTFALSTGVGVVGTFAKTDNPLRFIIYIIPIDLVTLIYLAEVDNRKLYKANLGIYMLSTLARGWSSGILFLLWIAVVRANGVRITLSRLLSWLIFIALAAPLILTMRFLVRDDGIGISEVMSVLEMALDGRNVYLYILGFVSDRLQHFTVLAHIFENREAIRAALQAGDIRPFFLDGPWPYTLSTLLGHRLAPELNSWLTVQSFGLDPDAVTYAVHVGVIGWPIIAPELLPIHLCYVGGLGLASMLLSRAIGSKAVIDLTWLLWLLFLMNGWFGAFVSYLLGLAFVRVLQLVARRDDRRPMAPKTVAARGVLGNVRYSGPPGGPS